MNYYQKALQLGCCSSPSSASGFYKATEKSYYRGTPENVYFSLGITFTKIRKPSRSFFQRYEKSIEFLITLESIMFYYTFSVINMFHLGTVLLHDSINWNIRTVHNSLEHVMWNLFDFSIIYFAIVKPLFCVDCFQKLCLSVNPTEMSRGRLKSGE